MPITYQLLQSHFWPSVLRNTIYRYIARSVLKFILLLGSLLNAHTVIPSLLNAAVVVRTVIPRPAVYQALMQYLLNMQLTFKTLADLFLKPTSFIITKCF